ncbi:MAG: toprim domain-containing protein, partial [Patescibacteria group bacterium]|nr:toprim domain-containing protein [Patescibacteria group bacterium]
MYLINSGYAVTDIERAGLNFKSERGGYIDRFRGRIMFPIYNHFGKTIGFSGRILPQYDNGEIGKYINSPETAIFNKSKILYGFHKSKNFIKEKKEAVLVEGQMDFLMAWQDGMKNVAATSGTALTPDHLAVLRRLTDKVIFCFDNDEAGLKAAERSIDLAQNRDLSVRLLILEDYKDPADAVKHKPGILEKL